MEVGAHQRIAVTERSQIAQLRQVVTECAHRLGLPEEQQHRAAIVATELGTNLVKHAPKGGEVLIGERSAGGGSELELIAIDRGAGMDVNACLVDGFSLAGSPGTGLGAIRRLSSFFDAHSSERGTVVLSRIGTGRPARTPVADAFQIGGVSVPMSGEDVCGDAWAIHSDGEDLTVVVADGLGHGVGAHDAALAVISVEPQITGGSVGLLERAHASAAHSRGAAAAVAVLRRQSNVMTFAGVGNVAATLLTPTTHRQAVSNNGTLGHSATVFREYAYPWSADALLVLYTDGLMSQWSLADGVRLRYSDPSIIAAVLYRDFSRQRDDVTVVVMREAP